MSLPHQAPRWNASMYCVFPRSTHLFLVAQLPNCGAKSMSVVNSGESSIALTTLRLWLFASCTFLGSKVYFVPFCVMTNLIGISRMLIVLVLLVFEGSPPICVNLIVF